MQLMDEMIKEFPVRKNREQKAAFRAWASSRAEAAGYAAHEETGGLAKSTNLVIGNPEKAKAIFTAHYDTPARMPLPNAITPCNVGRYLLMQLPLALVMLVPYFLTLGLVEWLTDSFALAYLLGLVVIIGILWLLMAGPANPHNVNDNTSGVAAVLTLMERIPREKQDEVAFILFDHEELGLLGSAAYASAHKDVRKNGLILNLDCVGVGEGILFFTPRKVRECPEYQALMDAMNAEKDREIVFNRMERTIYPSDQAQFKRGLAICACQKKRGVWLCTDLHTPRDTHYDEATMQTLISGLARFARSL